jgi:membrane protein YqaA with SNARE-associated domain
MRAFRQWLFGLFLSPGGLFLMAALDSTFVFWLPFGVDAAVIVLVVRRGFSWTYPVLAAAGSVTGAAVTFWTGEKIGEAGLQKYLSEQRLKRASAAVRKRGAVAIAALGIVPPPFPFTALVLASGALEVSRTTFLTTLAGVRLLRFGLEAAVAARYGRSVLRWLNSDIVETSVTAFLVLALVISAISLYKFFRSSRPKTHRSKARRSAPRRSKARS